jgi:hypothetical protein
MNRFRNQRIDEAAIALAHRGIFVTIKPAPPPGEMQIHVRCASGRLLSVMTDQSTPMLYEVVDLDHDGIQHTLGKKMPLLAMAELVLKEAGK